MWMSVEVVSGVRIVQCHAIIDVVIGVRVMLCHQAMDGSGFSTFLNFPHRVPILILLSCCINSSSLFPVAILCTLLHRENTSFEVWYLHCTKLGHCQQCAQPAIITHINGQHQRGSKISRLPWGPTCSNSDLLWQLSGS